MANQDHQTYIYIGLAGEGDGVGEGGLMRLADGDDRWQSMTNGLPDQPQVRALAVHPNDPAVIYAGTQLGPYRSDDRGEHWEALESPRPGMDVWSLAFHPNRSNVLFAGYEPCAIYRSEDGGASWKQMDTSRVRFPDVTTYMPPLAKRVIGIAVDPSEPENVYASIEVGGLLASRDGGETWDSITNGLYRENHTVDLHGVQVSPAAPGHIFIITQVAMFRSPDRGDHWEHVRFGEMFPRGSYCRGLIVAPDDPKTLYLAAGAGGGGAPSGTVEKGALFRSKDLADTWERVDIGEEPPSRMFQIAIDPRAAENVYCCSSDGHIYSSNDSGVSWKSGKMQTEMSRTRHVYPMVCA